MSQQLQRRTFLKGLGLSIGLPLLDAMTPSLVSAAAPLPTRMAFIFFPNGCIMPEWRPEGEGTGFKLGPTMEPLADVKSDINVISGLAQDNGFAHGDGAGDHARCAASYLTGAHPVKTSGADIRNGISVDQAAAAEVGRLTKLPSLEIGIERGRNAGSCDSGYSCAYSSNVSWKSATTPMAKEINPRLVFERRGGAERDKDSSRDLRDFYRKSILDLVADDAARLKKSLGQTDQRKMEEYFSSVRELEQRIVRAEQEAEAARPDYDLPAGIPNNFQEHVRLMYDMLVQAFQTDTTRISTFMLANAGNNRNYSWIGVNEGHHHLSHHRNKEDWVNKLAKIDHHLVGEFAYFVKQLKSVKEGEGTLLDNCMVMYGSGISDGNRHRHNDLPCILAGRGGGTIKTGRHIVVADDLPMNNLFLSMLDRMHAKIDSIGDSSGRLTVLDG